MYDKRIQDAMDLTEKGRNADAIRLLKACLSEDSSPNDRLMAAGMMFEIFLDEAGGEQALFSGGSPLQNEIQNCARIMVECYDQADEDVKEAIAQCGVYIPHVRRIAEGSMQMMQLISQAKQLQFDGNYKAAMRLLQKVVTESDDVRDRLFAAGLATAILESVGDQLYDSQATLQADSLKYAELTLQCFDEADSASQQAFIASGADIDTLRRSVRDLKGAEKGTHVAKSGCFVATAAYGSPNAAEVIILRRFRDHILRQKALGKRFIETYYRFSPPIAQVISESRLLKSLVRQLFLRPLVRVVRRVMREES